MTDRRDPLPTDVASLPALPTGYAETLDAGLVELGLRLDPDARSAIDDHVRLLLAWTAAINLTAIREPTAVAREHVLDSLTAVAVLRSRGARTSSTSAAAAAIPASPSPSPRRRSARCWSNRRQEGDVPRHRPRRPRAAAPGRGRRHAGRDAGRRSPPPRALAGRDRPGRRLARRARRARPAAGRPGRRPGRLEAPAATASSGGGSSRPPSEPPRSSAGPARASSRSPSPASPTTSSSSSRRWHRHRPASRATRPSVDGTRGDDRPRRHLRARPPGASAALRCARCASPSCPTSTPTWSPSTRSSPRSGPSTRSATSATSSATGRSRTRSSTGSARSAPSACPATTTGPPPAATRSSGSTPTPGPPWSGPATDRRADHGVAGGAPGSPRRGRLHDGPRQPPRSDLGVHPRLALAAANLSSIATPHGLFGHTHLPMAFARSGGLGSASIAPRSRSRPRPRQPAHAPQPGQRRPAARRRSTGQLAWSSTPRRAGCDLAAGRLRHRGDADGDAPGRPAEPPRRPPRPSGPERDRADVVASGTIARRTEPA